MGQGLLFHAQLDVLMVNHAEFMCYSMMDYDGNRPLWKFPWHGTRLVRLSDMDKITYLDIFDQIPQ